MAKLFFIISTLLFCVPATWAQKQYTQCEEHFFKNKKVSTSQCFDKDNRWGKATAYDKNGNVIYEKELRHVGGNSSVVFTYYPGGAVHIAKWHSAPDAGIQWYNTTTTFSEDGKIEHEEDNNYNMSPSTQVLKAPGEYKAAVKKQETDYCAVIYNTEYYYINQCRYPVEVFSGRIGSKPEDRKTVVVKPGETTRGGNFVMAQQFVNLSDYISFSMRPVTKKKTNPLTIKQQPNYATINKETRRYYYIINDLR